MKTPTKFVSPLKEPNIHELQRMMNNDPSPRVRMRSHSILLSAQGASIEEICKLFRVHRQSVSAWIDAWERLGTEGLHDKPRSGGPPKLDQTEREMAKDLIIKHPGAPELILNTLREETGKSISLSSLRRIAKAARLRWHPSRHSVEPEHQSGDTPAKHEEMAEMLDTDPRAELYAVLY